MLTKKEAAEGLAIDAIQLAQVRALSADYNGSLDFICLYNLRHALPWVLAEELSNYISDILYLIQTCLLYSGEEEEQAELAELQEDLKTAAKKVGRFDPKLAKQMRTVEANFGVLT